jgi:predicted phosphodiesterase
MKALILSDIHSNIAALEAIWTQERDSDVIYCAGDLVDYGPAPREVLAWVRDHRAVCVSGNHDVIVTAAYWAAERYHRRVTEDPQHAQSLLEGEVPWLEQVPATVGEREWRHHNAQLLDADDVAFLEALPTAVDFVLDGLHYGLTHCYQGYDVIPNAHAFETFVARTFAPTNNEPITRLIFGHTHYQGVHYLSDTLLWMNPGSVAYRRLHDPDQAAQYLTISDGRLSLRRITYAVTPLYHHVLSLDMKESERRAALDFFGPRATE